MKITNKWGLPEGLAAACTVERHCAPGTVSATQLMKGLREKALTERHWEEIKVDVAENIWAVFGTAAHKVLEREGQNDFTEVELSTEVGGIEVIGHIDTYNMKTGVVTDWKTASVWKAIKQDTGAWRQQGLIYAWLLKESGFKVTDVQFIALLKDWNKSAARRSADYPAVPVYTYKFTPTAADYEKTARYIKERVAEYKKYKDAPDDALPLCTDAERWYEPAYAVMKRGRKTAVKVCKREDYADAAHAAKEQAEILGGEGSGYYVEARGEHIKCVNFCLCREFCQFYQQLKEEGRT